MLNGSANKSAYLGERAIVIGAGVSGLSAARALADYFAEVIVLERDILPPDSTTRPGAPQGKQAHGLLGGAIKGLEELFPGFAQDVVQAGGLPVNVGSDILTEVAGLGSFPRREWDWVIYSLSRPLIELTMRRRVEQYKNILLRGGCRAVAIEGTPDGARVTGVRYENIDGGSETISAALVVDASKHGSLTLSFLESTGQPVPEETEIGIDVRYGTALVALSEDIPEKFKAIVTFPNAPEGIHAGYLLPIENGHFQLLLIGRGDDAPPVDGDAFLAYSKKLGTPAIYNATKNAKLLGEVARYGFPMSSWKHFGRLDRFPQGLLPIGDAICCLNPVYGQGITVAVQEVNILYRLLGTKALSEDPFANLSHEFLTETEALLEGPWAMSAIPDFVYPQTRGERPEDLEERLKSQGAYMRLATRDSAVHELLNEVRHLLKPLSALEEPDLVRRVKEVMATA